MKNIYNLEDKKWHKILIFYYFTVSLFIKRNQNQLKYAGDVKKSTCHKNVFQKENKNKIVRKNARHVLFSTNR